MVESELSWKLLGTILAELPSREYTSQAGLDLLLGERKTRTCKKGQEEISIFQNRSISPPTPFVLTIT